MVDQNSTIYTWGWNVNGQLGLDSDQDDCETIVSIPSSISILDENNLFDRIEKVSLGTRHSALLDEGMNLYMFGWNKYEQLFVDGSVRVNVFAPILIEEYKKKVLDVKCGSWFTIILTQE